MKAGECAHLWKSAAIEDGRLSGEEVASFERHAATCAACQEERRLLARLRDGGRSLPVLTSTPLQRRRQRHQLLAEVNRLLVSGASAPRPAWRFPLVIAASLTAAITLALVVYFRAGEEPIWRAAPASATPSIAAPAATPTYRSRHSHAANLREQREGATLRVAVTRGHFEIDVDSLLPPQRFLVTLPDGELEVRGTSFTIDVTESRTERVSVSHGRVELRLAGQRPLLLGAGDTWSAASDAVPASTSARPAAQLAASSASATRVPRHSIERAAERSAATATAAPPTETPPTAGAEFSLAMQAYQVGDFARAEELFVTFEQHHPSDQRVEDSVFLRAVSRARRGNDAGARTLAAAYLRRYPEGLRRKEAERLLDAQ